ncbi:hypothetical protein B0T24DRAFT_183918 [Lasiosphaeria ovina]|uniref:Uncharacterized protein n=1 Tax=Lasiosphaeria ovina TaxID=92902 RepID=A0AAE0NEN8_9PEZI|nr:hypothetical protein B0T24DRAFT_183918 [Lasiosphaeria ovina]
MSDVPAIIISLTPLAHGRLNGRPVWQAHGRKGKPLEPTCQPAWLSGSNAERWVSWRPGRATPHLRLLRDMARSSFNPRIDLAWPDLTCRQQQDSGEDLAMGRSLTPRPLAPAARLVPGRKRGSGVEGQSASLCRVWLPSVIARDSRQPR